MTKTIVALSLLLLSAGCVHIDQERLLPQGTKVEVMDVTGDGSMNTGYLANIDHKKIRQDLVKGTEEQLRRLNIETTHDSPEAARLKYRINYIKFEGGELEVGYHVSLETSDGGKVFDDQDEKQDDAFEGIIAKIGKRVAAYTDKSFRKPATAVQAEKQRFNTDAATPSR